MEEIGGWSVYQLRMMLAEEADLGGTTKMSPAQAKALRGQRRGERAEAIDRLMLSARAWRGRLGMQE